jgi:alkylated DNA nucleotide flippase Atl1
MNVLLAGQKNLQVDRSTLLPSNYVDIIKELANLNVSTYGDLAFISQMDPMPDNITKALAKLSEFGLDQDVLKRIV